MVHDTLVLMYHAIPGSSRACHTADPHYCVERAGFVRHLDLMQELGLKPRSVRDVMLGQGPMGQAPGVALTFDDGHESNFAAYAEIARRGGSADLFINPSLVGQRGFLSWAQLRELAAQGASIQSHGQRHVFLDELPAAEVRREPSLSRRHIADELGIAPSLFAPPNGRLPADGVQLACDQGYAAVCSSQVGVWRETRQREIPRFAVLAGTPESQLRGWLTRSPWVMTRSHARAALLRSAKRVLGNQTYRALRSRLLLESPPP